jgi:hypothetical protein
MKTNYQNIPASGYNSLRPEFVTKPIMASMRQSDQIVLSPFSILQLISGLTHIQQHEDKEYVKYFIDNALAVMRVAGLLYAAHIGPKFKGEEEQLKFEVTREDMEVMVKLLKIRMTHCEKQRDNRDLNFNPDTYIGQKLLLIDLKEWLMIEAIVLDNIMEEESKHPVSAE